MPKELNPQLVRRLKFFSGVLGAAVSLIGFLALAGWQFDIIFLKRVIPALPVIAPNTACAFFLGGLILFLLPRPKISDQKNFRAVFYFFSFIIALTGLLTLAEYIFGLNLGIDRLLFSGAQGQTTVRMSPQSAFNFLMMGASLVFVISRKNERIRIGQVIILLAGAVSLVSLFGFIYSITTLYTISPYKGMAAHTAVAFVAMFFGILLANPAVGFVRIFSSRSLSGVTARRLFAVLIFVLAAEMVAALGKRGELIGVDAEQILHLLIVAAAFVYLIFFAFRSLDELAKMETSLARSKELDKAKTEFVGLASHQLRTPLTSVSWYAEMLISGDVGELNKKQKEYLGEIYDGNHRMIDLVDDLLNTSRIDMGTLKVKPQPVNLVEVMENILSEFLPEVEEKKTIVEKKFSRNLPAISLDPELLGIVFQNIISNAVKYASPGGKISVEIRKQDAQILVKIADNGWGIPAAQQKKIFTKLFRADNVRKRDTEGTGLGLYIAKAIVKKSGGKIWFESKEGKGTTFYITFKAQL